MVYVYNCQNRFAWRSHSHQRLRTIPWLLVEASAASVRQLLRATWLADGCPAHCHGRRTFSGDTTHCFWPKKNSIFGGCSDFSPNTLWESLGNPLFSPALWAKLFLISSIFAKSCWTLWDGNFWGPNGTRLSTTVGMPLLVAPPLKLGGLPPIAAWTYIKPNLGSYLMMNCFESGQSGWCSLTCGDTKVRTQYEFRQKYLFSLHHLINFSTNPNIPPYEGTTVWSNLVIWQWNHTHSMSIFSRAQWLMKIMMHTNSFPAKWLLELRQKHVDSSEINPSEDKNFELLWTSSLLPVMAE